MWLAALDDSVVWVVSGMRERVPRWRIAVGVSLGLAAVGGWQATPVIVVAAMIPIGYVVYSALTSAVNFEEQLRVTRRVTPARTYPGGIVEIELEIEHVGETSLADVRMVDRVPARLAVIDGSPRAALGLRPGDTAKITYTLRARHGEFEFDPVRVRTTSLSGASIYTAEVPADGDTQLSAQLGVDEYPLSQQTIRSTGAVATDRGGAGLEFFGTRAYQPSDPVNRIDWRQYAERRELTTVEYRQEEAVEVVVVLDARSEAAVAAGDSAPTGVELCVYAASETVDGLLTARNRVGIATFGVADGDTTGSFGWIPPDNGRELRSRIRTTLDAAVATVQKDTTSTDGGTNSDSAVGMDPASAKGDTKTATDRGADPSAPGDMEISRLVDRLSPRTQVVVFTPACDDAPVTLVQQLRSAGHAVSVCSPDVTAGGTPGSTLASVERGIRLATLRKTGATVVDWTAADSLAVVLEQAVLRQAEHGAAVSTGGSR